MNIADALAHDDGDGLRDLGLVSGWDGDQIDVANITFDKAACDLASLLGFTGITSFYCAQGEPEFLAMALEVLTQS